MQKDTSVYLEPITLIFSMWVPFPFTEESSFFLFVFLLAMNFLSKTLETQYCLHLKGLKTITAAL